MAGTPTATLSQSFEANAKTTAAISDVLTAAFNGTAATPGLVTAISEGSKAIASAIADPTAKLFLTTIIASGAAKIDELLKALSAEHERQGQMLEVATRLAYHLEHATITIDGALNSLPSTVDRVGSHIDRSLTTTMLPVLAQLGAVSEQLGSIHRVLSAQKEAPVETIPFETMKWYLEMIFRLENSCRLGETLRAINDACRSVRDDARFEERCTILAAFGLAVRFKTLFRKLEKADEEERTERLSELFRLRQDLDRHISFAD